MTVTVKKNLKDVEEVARIAAAELATRLSELLASKPSVNLVLTGGTVGIRTLEHLAPLLNGLDLSKLELWWGDDRFVERSSPDRNFVQATKALLSSLPIADSNLHPMPSSDDGELDVAAEVFAEIIQHQSPKFDIVLLGMGSDGHVASLFPESEPVAHGSWIVSEPNSPKPPAGRISMSYEALSSSTEVWFLVSGADKAGAVAKVFSGEKLPATLVSGRELTKWYLDEAAASEITS